MTTKRIDINPKKISRVILVFILSASAVLALFFWQGHKGLDLSDEGFLWYGAQRVLVNEVPIRDFMGYDPGRYYWSAAFMRVWNDNGVLALRRAAAIFQVLGLFIALVLIAGSLPKWDLLFLLPASLTLLVWMFPRHKLYDISVSIALVGALSFLVRHRSPRWYFIAGLCVGIAAVFGRNHGMYGVAGSLGVIAWLAFHRGNGPGVVKSFFLWISGVTLGFLPVLMMVVSIDGFAKAFWESVVYIFDEKTINLPLPVPWPWKVPWGRDTLIGFFFIAIILYGVIGLTWVILRKYRHQALPNTVVASVFLSLPYATFAYSRADVNHLAQAIFPLLIGVLVILGRLRNSIKWPITLLFFCLSCYIMLPIHPGWRCHFDNWGEAEVLGSKIKIQPYTANHLSLLNTLVRDYAPNGRNFIVTPFWPGAYCLKAWKSPMWEVFALFPRNEVYQRAEIERIKKADPGFVMVIDIPLDGRDELRFINTHPLIDQYFQKNYELIKGYTQDGLYQIYKSKSVTVEK